MQLPVANPHAAQPVWGHVPSAVACSLSSEGRSEHVTHEGSERRLAASVMTVTPVPGGGRSKFYSFVFHAGLTHRGAHFCYPLRVRQAGPGHPPPVCLFGGCSSLWLYPCWPSLFGGDDSDTVFMHFTVTPLCKALHRPLISGPPGDGPPSHAAGQCPLGPGPAPPSRSV